MFFLSFFFWVNGRLVIGVRSCTVLLTNRVKPPNESCETDRRRGRRQGRFLVISVVVVGVSLMTSSWQGLVDLPHCSWAALVPRIGPVLRSQPASRDWPTAAGLYSSVADVPRTSPFWRISSSSFWVSSSIRLISSMVKPTHLSIQQNSWRWKLVKIRFSCLWMKPSTLVCRPHHLNLTVTSLYAHMYGQSVFSSFFHSGLRGPLPVLSEWKRAGSSSDL